MHEGRLGRGGRKNQLELRSLGGRPEALDAGHETNNVVDAGLVDLRLPQPRLGEFDGAFARNDSARCQWAIQISIRDISESDLATYEGSFESLNSSVTTACIATCALPRFHWTMKFSGAVIRSQVLTSIVPVRRSRPADASPVVHKSTPLDREGES